MTCDVETLAKLAGLAMQAEYGDHSRAALDEGIFTPEYFFSSRIVRRFGAAVMESNALREHRSCAGIPESQAEIEYIKVNFIDSYC